MYEPDAWASTRQSGPSGYLSLGAQARCAGPYGKPRSRWRLEKRSLSSDYAGAAPFVARARLHCGRQGYTSPDLAYADAAQADARILSNSIVTTPADRGRTRPN